MNSSTSKSQLFLFLFLLLILPATIYLARQNQDVRKKAQVPKEEQKIQSPPKPEYKEGEIIIKFKIQSAKFKTKTNINKSLDKEAVSFSELDDATIPQSLKIINQKYNVSKIEKVFKGAEEPQKELNKFKQRFSKEIAKGERKINEKELLKIDLSRTHKLTFDQNIPVEQVVKELSQNPDIEYAEPNYYVYAEAIPEVPNDPYFQDSFPGNTSNRDLNWNPPFDYQWNIKKTNSSQNWLIDTSQVVVAVIDTGVDMTHPELGNKWINVNEIPNNSIDDDNNGCVDDINGCNTTSYVTNGEINDVNNHGTHVAGVISAKTNNQLGLAGITNNTPIMAVRVFDSNGTASEDWTANGVLYAVNNGARILNMSIGGSNGAYTFKDALDYAVAHNVIPVAAAGNGNIYSPSGFPASYKPAITVGGVDEELNKMKYAGYGPNIDVVAPGGGKNCDYHSKPGYCSNILSLKSSQNTNDQDLVVGNQFLRLSGTSMATPHVAGIVALLLAQRPEFTLQDIENYIRLNSINPLGTVHTEKLGWGVINSTGNDFIAPSNIDFEVIYPADNSLVGNQFYVAGTIKADNFSHFSVEYRLSNTADWIVTSVILENNGLTQIAPSTTYPAKIATINLPENSQKGVYEIKTTLYLASGRSISDIKYVNYQKKEGTKWLYSVGAPNGGSILIADLNNDGSKEIIIYNKFSVEVYDKNYLLLWNTDTNGEVVVGNIDNRSPEKEVVVSTTGGTYFYRSDGSLISNMTLVSAGGSIIMDTDGNGKNELCGSNNCYEQSDTGTMIQKFQYANPILIYAAGDVTGDGHKEIVGYNQTQKRIDVINYLGQLVSQHALSGTYPVDGLILVDVDGDNKEEIAFHQKWGETKLLKYTGNSVLTVVWSVNNSNNLQQLAAADFNNDSYPEIYVTVNNTSNAQIIDKSGNSLYNSWTYFYFSNSSNAYILLADYNNDEFVEFHHIGLHNVDHRVYKSIQEFNYLTGQSLIIDGDWKSIIPQWSSLSGDNDQIYYNLYHPSAAIVDLDNNGKLDLVIAGVGIIEYDTQGKVFWPHRYHDYQRTNSYNFKPAEVFSVPLTTGWNLIAVPLTGSPVDIFQSISGKYDQVYAYNGCDSSDPWKLYDPNAPPFANDLTAIDNQSGYWIKATQATTLSVEGTQQTSISIPLCTGWNLIAYPALTEVTLPDALSGIAGKYESVYAYEATDAADPWKIYNPNVPPYVNDLKSLKSGKGYWIKATMNTTLVINN